MSYCCGDKHLFTDFLYQVKCHKLYNRALLILSFILTLVMVVVNPHETYKNGAVSIIILTVVLLFLYWKVTKLGFMVFCAYMNRKYSYSRISLEKLNITMARIVDLELGTIISYLIYMYIYNDTMWYITVVLLSVLFIDTYISRKQIKDILYNK